MATIVNAFPLTIFRQPISIEEVERERVAEAILAMEASKIQQSPGSSWTGDTNGAEFLHNDPRFEGVFAKFREPIAGYLETLRLEQDKLELYFARSWGTISRGGQAIQPHSHSQAHISLVYYLKKPEDSSGITFMDHDVPNQFAPNLFNETMLQAGLLKEIQQLNAQRIFLEPKQDDVLLFPSKTIHAILPNNSREPRISIAVDIVATVKDSRGLEYVLPQLDSWKAVQ